MTAWPESVGVVGCGAMGRAFAVGLTSGHEGIASTLVLSDAVPEARETAIAEAGGREGSVEEAGASDLVVVAVKPDDLAGVIAAVTPVLTADAVLASVAAGRSLGDLSSAGAARVARLMPNLAVRHGAGVIALATRGLSSAEVERLKGFLGVLGTVTELEERLFDVATALAGSGPGIVALVAEALEDGAVEEGLRREDARAMVQAVLAGTAALLADGGHPAALRERVSSPGGTTVAALRTLEEAAVRVHLAAAVRSATERSGEL